MPKLFTRGENKKELQLTLARDTRIRQVMELVGQGTKIATIAKQFSVDERTIYKDLDLIRKHLKENTLGGDLLERAAHYNELQRMRVQRWWNMYNKDGQTDRMKAHALTQLKAEEELSIKKDQIIGLLPQEHVSTAIQVNNTVMLTPDQLNEAIIRLHDKAMRKKTIASNTGTIIEHTPG